MRKLAIVGAMVVAMAAVLIPPLAHYSSAWACEPCTPGLSPGFWKNHAEAWPVCPNLAYLCALGVGPDISLMEALNARGGGENAFLRQSAASYLNALSISGFPLDVETVRSVAAAAYLTGEFEFYKHFLEQYNSA